jgi:hypothetical protein
VEQSPLTKEEYVEKVLQAYRHTPGTMGTVRRPDRLIATQWYERNIPLAAVENGIVLAVARRLYRWPGAPPLGTIRSLTYFAPVIEEVRRMRVSPDYFQYLRGKVQEFLQLQKMP